MPDTTRQPTGEYPRSTTARRIDLEEAADTLVATLAGKSRQSQSLGREAGVSLVMMALESGDLLAEHSAKGTVTVHVLRGHATLTAAGESFDLRPGQLVMMQPRVRHDVHAEEQSVVLLTIAGGDE